MRDYAGWTCPECGGEVDVRDVTRVRDEDMMRPCSECRAHLCEFCPKGDCLLCDSPACSNCGQQIGEIWICAQCKPVVARLLAAVEAERQQAETRRALDVAAAQRQIILAGADPMAARQAFANLGAAIVREAANA